MKSAKPETMHNHQDCHLQNSIYNHWRRKVFNIGGAKLCIHMIIGGPLCVCGGGGGGGGRTSHFQNYLGGGPCCPPPPSAPTPMITDQRFEAKIGLTSHRKNTHQNRTRINIVIVRNDRQTNTIRNKWGKKNVL